jgi:cytochrome bd-type quinol oxidase subunit 2
MGLLIGLGLSFPYMNKHKNFHFRKIIALPMLFIVILLAKFFPTASKTNEMLFILTTIIKHSFISLTIYMLLPFIVSYLNQKCTKAKLT